MNTIIYLANYFSSIILEKNRKAAQEYNILPANTNKAMPTLLQGSNLSPVTNMDFFCLIELYFWLSKLPPFFCGSFHPQKPFSM